MLKPAATNFNQYSETEYECGWSAITGTFWVIDGGSTWESNPPLASRGYEMTVLKTAGNTGCLVLPLLLSTNIISSLNSFN
jgi:hypothetical protein